MQVGIEPDAARDKRTDCPDGCRNQPGVKRHFYKVGMFFNEPGRLICQLRRFLKDRQGNGSRDRAETLASPVEFLLRLLPFLGDFGSGLGVLDILVRRGEYSAGGHCADDDQFLRYAVQPFGNLFELLGLLAHGSDLLFNNGEMRGNIISRVQKAVDVSCLCYKAQ